MEKLDLHGKDKSELQVILKDLREKLVSLHFELAEKKLKDLSQIGKTRRDIARVMTGLNIKS